MHQFFKIKNLSTYEGTQMRPKNEGVQVVCAICGQLRNAWDDGRVEVVIEGNKDDHDKTNNTTRPA